MFARAPPAHCVSVPWCKNCPFTDEKSFLNEQHYCTIGDDQVLLWVLFSSCKGNGMPQVTLNEFSDDCLKTRVRKINQVDSFYPSQSVQFKVKLLPCIETRMVGKQHALWVLMNDRISPSKSKPTLFHFFSHATKMQEGILHRTFWLAFNFAVPVSWHHIQPVLKWVQIRAPCLVT